MKYYFRSLSFKIYLEVKNSKSSVENSFLQEEDLWFKVFSYGGAIFFFLLSFFCQILW